MAAAATIVNSIEPPPRSTGRPEIDGVGALQYLWSFYTKAILSGGLLQTQNLDPALVSLGDLVATADQLPYFTAEDTFDLTGFTAFARTLLDDADASDARDTLGAGTVRTVTGTAPIASTGDAVDPVISIDDFVGSGATHARGAVPDPGAVAGTTKYLREDATWADPPGGDVVGPASATDGNVVLFDGATGKIIKDGGTLGTAAFTASGAYQPADTDLTAIAALVSAANKVPYSTGAGAWALADFTAAGRALLDDASAADQRTTLGLGTAATHATGDYDASGAAAAAQAASQPVDADLTAIAALSSAADKVPYSTAAQTWALAAFTAVGRALAGAANVAAQWTALGLGSAAGLDKDEGTGNATATGPIASTSWAYTYSKIGKQVSVSFEDFAVAGNSTAAYISLAGMPTALLPTGGRRIVVNVLNAGTQVAGYVYVNTITTWRIYVGTGNNFTASGSNHGGYGITVSYAIN